MDHVEVKYRLLQDEEKAKLLPTLIQEGWLIPYPTTASIMAAEIEGKIIGFCVMQLVPHIEPLYVDASWRGTGLSEELARKAIAHLHENNVNYFVAGSGNPASDKLCETVGMEKLCTSMWVGKPN